MKKEIEWRRVKRNERNRGASDHLTLGRGVAEGIRTKRSKGWRKVIVKESREEDEDLGLFPNLICSFFLFFFFWGGGGEWGTLQIIS